MTGLPNFSKKKNAENKWSLHKEGLQGRQVTDALRVFNTSLPILYGLFVSALHLKFWELNFSELGIAVVIQCCYCGRLVVPGPI